MKLAEQSLLINPVPLNSAHTLGDGFQAVTEMLTMLRQKPPDPQTQNTS